MLCPRTFRHFGAACLLVALCCSLSIQSALAADDKPADTLAAKLQPLVDHHTLAGAVLLVANKDKVLDVESVGFADIASAKPMRADNLFWIASQSKAITAAGLMMLVDAGKVQLDDPVEKYLPEFKDVWVAVERDGSHELLKRPKAPITVRQILSHTSGMRFSSPLETPTLDMLPLAVAVRSYAMTPLNTEPGTKWDYANAGINTAGRIIEVVSGMPYEDFLQQRLFTPLGMKDTTFWPNEEQLTRLAKSYKANKARDNLEEVPVTQLHYPLNDHHRQPMPAGGLFSTAGDVAVFCRMLLNGGTLAGKQYLSADAVRAMTTDETGALKHGYGFGLSVDKKPGGPFGHGGAYKTDMSIDPEHQIITVYMVQQGGDYANTDGGKILPTFRTAARELFGK